MLIEFNEMSPCHLVLRDVIVILNHSYVLFTLISYRYYGHCATVRELKLLSPHRISCECDITFYCHAILIYRPEKMKHNMMLEVFLSEIRQAYAALRQKDSLRS